MTLWFLQDPHRLEEERKGLDALAGSVDWLLGHEWLLDDGGIACDVTIQANAITYELRISFPALYPDTPPIVRPVNEKTRISGHQYGGADGPLCLEWGPDNWHRGVTAANMLESAFKLLAAENPARADPGHAILVASRHSLELGQELRGEYARWYFSPTFESFLKQQSNKGIGVFRFSLEESCSNFRVLVHEARPLDGELWIDSALPPGVVPEIKNMHVGAWFKTAIPPETLRSVKSIDDLKRQLGAGAAEFLVFDGTSPIEGLNAALPGVLVEDSACDCHLFIVLSEQKLIKCHRLAQESSASGNRAPDSTLYLGKKIGIIGLGSAGSKIAISLARMGARNFYLVDFDVLLPGNIRRHALDWETLLQHKVDGVADALSRIAPDIEVDVSRVNIAGQESNAVVAGVLDRLAKCDLLLDATAESRVFNLLSAVARRAAHPLVWLEIFGGGLGGLVARSRPSVEPRPQEMRTAFLGFCAANPLDAPLAKAGDYGVQTASGEVLVATDSDVAIIASHAAQFVTDSLRAPEESKFPHSMYLVGLKKGWVFDAPFSTIPISFPAGAATESAEESTGFIPESALFIAELIDKAKK